MSRVSKTIPRLSDLLEKPTRLSTEVYSQPWFIKEHRTESAKGKGTWTNPRKPGKALSLVPVESHRMSFNPWQWCVKCIKYCPSRKLAPAWAWHRRPGFYQAQSRGCTLPGTYQNFRFPEGKQVFNICPMVCTNISGSVNNSYQLGNGGKHSWNPHCWTLAKGDLATRFRPAMLTFLHTICEVFRSWAMMLCQRLHRCIPLTDQGVILFTLRVGDEPAPNLLLACFLRSHSWSTVLAWVLLEADTKTEEGSAV